MTGGRRRTGRRSISVWGMVAVLASAVWPALHGVYWAIPLTGAATAAALAGWRLVALYEHDQAQQSALPPPLDVDDHPDDHDGEADDDDVRYGR